MIRGAAAVVILSFALSACTANPPPPIESTDSPKPTTPTEPTKNTVVVAIDDIGLGFNSHLLADQSPANAAVSSMVLPSPFRPVRNPAGVTEWVPDPSVIVSADVTAQEPFTVTYQLRNEAQWSDGAPIAAEDFRYLWQQMLSEPGTADPAGYGLIDDVGSSGGGKTVTVKMNAAYPAWRELFADLLPSHLVKDSPGGFARGLAEGIPVSGSLFRIKSIDRGRDEILLERNDRFWDEPAKPDQILMRRAGSPDQLAESIRSDDSQLAVVRGGAVSREQLSAIPNVRAQSTLQPRALSLTLNGRVRALSDERVRGALLSMLDPGLLAAVGAAGGAASVPARAQVLSPSDAGYAPTAPPRLGTDQILGLLESAGYSQAASPGGRITKDGKPFSVRIGTVEDDATAIAVAATLADQWRSAGIDATVEQVQADELYGTRLTENAVDAIVGWHRAGADAATSLASRFGCPPPPESGSAPTTLDGSPTPTAAPSRSAAQQAPANLSGACDPSLQPAIESALRGTADVGEVIAQAEPRLWQLAVSLPVLQDGSVVAATDGVAGVALDGPIQVGVFGGAAQWSRATS